MQVIHLAAAQQFAQQCFFDGRIIGFHDKGAYRQTPGWRGGDDRQVAHAGYGHIQGARNRCGGQSEDVHLAAQGLHLLLLAHAKAVLFVDDYQTEVFNFHIVLQQLVRADHDVDVALGQLRHGGINFFCGLEAAHHLDGDRPVGEAVAKAVVVLLSEQGGRHQNRHLLAAVHGNKRRTHGHFGFTKAHIAADQTIHRLAAEHVGFNRFDGGLLVGGFFKGKAGAEGGVVGQRVAKRIALTGGAAGVDVEQFSGHITHLFGGFAFGLLPDFRAEAVQGRQGVVAAGVAGNQMQAGHWHIELGLFGIHQGEKLGRLVVDLQRYQT